MKLRDANRKKLFHTSSSCILPSFSQNASRLLLPKRFWKCESTISFRKYKQKVVLLLLIYLFNYDSSKSNFFMLNMTFDVVLSKSSSHLIDFATFSRKAPIIWDKYEYQFPSFLPYTTVFLAFFRTMGNWIFNFLQYQDYKIILSSLSLCVFWYVLYYKNLIGLHWW